MQIVPGARLFTAVKSGHHAQLVSKWWNLRSLNHVTPVSTSLIHHVLACASHTHTTQKPVSSATQTGEREREQIKPTAHSSNASCLNASLRLDRLHTTTCSREIIERPVSLRWAAEFVYISLYSVTRQGVVMLDPLAELTAIPSRSSNPLQFDYLNLLHRFALSFV